MLNLLAPRSSPGKKRLPDELQCELEFAVAGSGAADGVEVAKGEERHGERIKMRLI